MPGFDLTILHQEFPNLPERIVDFFLPENARRVGRRLQPKTIYELASAVSKPAEKRDDSRHMPKWQHLNKICKILAEYDILISYGGGGPHGWEEAYMTNINDDRHIRIAPYLNYIVYGFPVIFEDYKNSVIPIISNRKDHDRQVGTVFFVKKTP